MSDITLEMNEIDRLKVNAMLSGVKGGPSRVFSRAINKMLAGVQTDANKEITNVITMKKRDVATTFTLHKATVKSLSAKVICSDGPESLIKFSNTQRKKGISVKVLKSGERETLKHAFYTTITRTKWISQRIAKWFGTGSGKKMQPSFAANLPDKYRFPLKRLTGPRVTDILGKPAVIARVQEKADERLRKNINQELNYELSKL